MYSLVFYSVAELNTVFFQKVVSLESVKYVIKLGEKVYEPVQMFAVFRMGALKRGPLIQLSQMMRTNFTEPENGVIAHEQAVVDVGDLSLHACTRHRLNRRNKYSCHTHNTETIQYRIKHCLLTRHELKAWSVAHLCQR